ncbi:transcriptional regulator, TetR family [Acinetobacter marinus]|uniref:Transcriptional regulator, TetR family n=1 Tax=Acinetobacter marinus TaxID=281375 RepID=A0A1G6NYX1_9GAMM|nr:TetR/AcrR family transcriptional regulator [Acinetobacter marinus]SDC72851.1 transcriptional regulator, TetR family [Acinetobacter marinus]
MQPQVGRPKDLKKRQAILEAATQCFLRTGYEGTSMDSIAKLANVSKLTVYNHFQDKAHLFGAAISMVCDQRLPKHFYQLDIHKSVEAHLFELSVAFLKMVYSDEAIKLHQLMTSLASQEPDLVALFFNSGPQQTRTNLLSLFQQFQQHQLIDIDDELLAIDLFCTLMTDVHHDRVLWGIDPVPDLAKIQTKVKHQLAIFFKVYPLR